LGWWSNLANIFQGVKTTYQQQCLAFNDVNAVKLRVATRSNGKIQVVPCCFDGHLWGQSHICRHNHISQMLIRFYNSSIFFSLSLYIYISLCVSKYIYILFYIYIYIYIYDSLHIPQKTDVFGLVELSTTKARQGKGKASAPPPPKGAGKARCETCCSSMNLMQMHSSCLFLLFIINIHIMFLYIYIRYIYIYTPLYVCISNNDSFIDGQCSIAANIQVDLFQWHVDIHSALFGLNCSTIPYMQRWHQVNQVYTSVSFQYQISQNWVSGTSQVIP